MVCNKSLPTEASDDEMITYTVVLVKNQIGVSHPSQHRRWHEKLCLL